MSNWVKLTITSTKANGENPRTGGFYRGIRGCNFPTQGTRLFFSRDYQAGLFTDPNAHRVHLVVLHKHSLLFVLACVTNIWTDDLTCSILVEGEFSYLMIGWCCDLSRQNCKSWLLRNQFGRRYFVHHHEIFVLLFQNPLNSMSTLLKKRS